MTREPTPALYATRGPDDLEVAAIRKELARSRCVVVAGGTEDWWSRDAAPDPEEVRVLLGADRARADRQPTPERRVRFIVSRLMLRATAGALLGTDPALFEIAYTPTGRPHLRGCDDLDISVGDCEGLVAVGLMDGGRVGVDVAPLRPPPLRLPSVEHLLTRYELERLRAALPAARHPLLLRFLTLKNSYAKAMGSGRRIPYADFGLATDGDGCHLMGKDGRFHVPGLGAASNHFGSTHLISATGVVTSG
ncbi:4'-phosphopantetheinyl transferase superfamily protein [Streptomyces sp. NPDC006660]|uniref:4'-phosphopantetheinyl transferase family protein n=1 Tax=Streptomyces sp. NPDC006660 TaxID=3156901 RepID=UPI0033FEB4B7